jgi:hypothetical protein
MKNLMIGIMSLVIILILVGCADPVDPQFRVHNERAEKANVQRKTSGGNTININDVQSGQTTALQSVAEGNIDVTAVIQNELFSPEVSFFAVKDTRYTIVIAPGIPPFLRVDRN